MSRQVTVTRTIHTTSSESTAIVVNTGHFKTCPGVLKILQLLLGIVCVGIEGYYLGTYWGRASYGYSLFRPELFFLLISTTALITTACIIFSMCLSLGTTAILPKTFFEVVYHFIIFLLLVAASITLLVVVSDNRRYIADYEPRIAASVIGLINGALYLGSFIMAIRSWRIQ